MMSMWRQQKNTIFFLPRQSHSEKQWMWEYEQDGIVLQEMRWKKLTSIVLFGEYTRLHRFTQLSFWEEITPRICALSEIQVRNQPTVQKLFDVTQKNDPSNKNRRYRECQSRVGDILHEAVPGERRRGAEAHEGKVYTFSDPVLCVGKMREFLHTNDSWGKSTLVVQGHTAIQRRIEWNEGRTSGVRVEDIPRTHLVADLLRNLMNFCKPWIVNQNTSKNELSWCRCWTISIGDIKTTSGYVRQTH